MAEAFDKTEPNPSRWDQDGTEYIRSGLEWCARCSTRLLALHPGLTAEMALDLAQELSLDDRSRARTPELVAEEVGNAGLRLDE